MSIKRILVVLLSITAVVYCSIFAYRAVQQAGWEHEAAKWVGDRANYLIVLIFVFLFIGLAMWKFLRAVMPLQKDQSLGVTRTFGNTLFFLLVITMFLSLINDHILGDTETVITKIGVSAMLIFVHSLSRIFGAWDKFVDRWI